jgi:hypothetical protein
MVLCKTNALSAHQYIQALLGLMMFLFALPVMAEQEAVWQYTVRPGDNLITLGKTHLINPDDWKTLQQLNQVNNPYLMPVGKVLQIPLSLVKQGPASAEVIFVSGYAHLQESAKSSKALAVGDKLGPGANIVTKDNSKVVIQFADGSTTEMASNSKLSLDSMSLYSGGAMVDTKLRLQNGQIETHANPEHIDGNGMQVITPSAIAAVRGTKFRVTADQKVTTQETLDGQVALDASNQQVIVNKGYGSKATFGQPPIPPVVLLSAPNTVGFNTQYSSLPVSFELPAMQGAVAWAARVAMDKQFDHLVAEGETLDNQLVFADLPDGQLYLNLRAKDKENIAGYEAIHTFVLNARPFQPELVSPAFNSTVRESRPVLQWRNVEDADFYSVSIATDATFKEIVETAQVKELDYKIQKDLIEGQYFWRVSSVTKLKNGKEDIGPDFKMSQFSFKPLPSKPDISHLQVKVSNNRVFVEIDHAPDGLSYVASLDNEFNHQKQVWQGRGLGNAFNFLLKEYGKQTLYIQYLDGDGVVGPAAVYEFYAYPQ